LCTHRLLKAAFQSAQSPGSRLLLPVMALLTARRVLRRALCAERRLSCVVRRSALWTFGHQGSCKSGTLTLLRLAITVLNVSSKGNRSVRSRRRKNFQAVQRTGKKEGREGRSNGQGSRSVGRKQGNGRVLIYQIYCQIHRDPERSCSWRGLKPSRFSQTSRVLLGSQASKRLLRLVVSLTHRSARFPRGLRPLLCRRLSSVPLANIH